MLIAGLGGLGRFWHPFAARMAATHRVLSFDHPGMGASPNTGAQRIEHIVEELLRLLDALGIERFSCIGHSTGGLVAQALALDHPARVASLVLSSTWARPDRRFRDLFELRRIVLQRAGEGAYAALGRLLGYTPEWYEAELAGPDLPDWHTGDAAAAALTAARIDMLLGYDRAAELGAIRQPTLIVGAADDQIVSFNHASDLARRIPHAELVELSGGHFVPATRTADYATLVRTFLQTHG